MHLQILQCHVLFEICAVAWRCWVLRKRNHICLTTYAMFCFLFFFPFGAIWAALTRNPERWQGEGAQAKCWQGRQWGKKEPWGPCVEKRIINIKCGNTNYTVANIGRIPKTVNAQIKSNARDTFSLGRCHWPGIRSKPTPWSSHWWGIFMHEVTLPWSSHW